VLFGNAYGQDNNNNNNNEQVITRMDIVTNQIANLLGDSEEITNTCTKLVNYGQIQVECLNYLKDFKSSMKDIVEKYESIATHLGIDSLNYLKDFKSSMKDIVEKYESITINIGIDS
jgi:hypothetical protein